MRIAMIGSRGITSDYGGIERVLDEVCPRLVELGHSVDVYSRADIRLDRGGLRAVPVRSFGGKHLDNIVRSALATVRSIGRYDLLHFHAIGPGMLALPAAALGQASVATIHGLDWRRAKWGALAKLGLRAAERALVAGATTVTVVSRTLERHFREAYGLNPSFIPNGTAAQAPAPLGAFGRSLGLEEGGYVLFASRLVPEKGCHDLIEAFCALPTAKKLVVAGGAGEPGYVESLRRMADPDRVVFTGHQTGAELAGLFSNARAFVLPSYVEGMSNALLEALAYGRTVLVSDIEENAEVVGDDGSYFKVGDVADLRSKLSGLLSRPDPATGTPAGPGRTWRPGWDEVASSYDALYRRLAARTPVARPAAVAHHPVSALKRT